VIANAAAAISAPTISIHGFSVGPCDAPNPATARLADCARHEAHGKAG
jgi:hypothetical protein